MENFNEQIAEARKNIENIKSFVIGLSKYMNSTKFDLIIGVDENSLDIITFTGFGIIQQTFGIPKNRCNYSMFPDDKNLVDMTNNPIEFNNFIKENFE